MRQVLFGVVLAFPWLAALISCDSKQPLLPENQWTRLPAVVPQVPLIPFTVLERTERGTIKVSYTVLVEPVGDRLPNEAELAAVSRGLRARDPRHERMFVLFYLPGMDRDSWGAFATAHHEPDLRVQINEDLLRAKYPSLVPKSPLPAAPESSTSPPMEVGEGKWQLDLSARPLPGRKVEFTITTNIPLPIDVMAEVHLVGGKPRDPWIGYQERVGVDKSPMVIVLDTSKSEESLPKGNYEARVFFNSRYAKNPQAAAIKGSYKPTCELGTLGSGESAAARMKREQQQRWVMENIIGGDAWSPIEWWWRFGKSEEVPLDAGLNPRVLKAFYFPDIDMTFIVNTLKGEITAWRLGRKGS